MDVWGENVWGENVWGADVWGREVVDVPPFEVPTVFLIVPRTTAFEIADRTSGIENE